MLGNTHSSWIEYWSKDLVGDPCKVEIKRPGLVILRIFNVGSHRW